MITFVATMFNEMDFAKMFISALLCQTNPNWKCIIYHNGPNYNLSELNFLLDSRFEILQSETNTGMWGTLNRQEAISNRVNTNYIIQTSIQDYWMPNAVEEILKHSGVDFIYWNSINHLFTYSNILNCEPIPGFIDWGNFAIKTPIAKVVGIKRPREFTADGLFVKDCLSSGLINSKIKIPQILTIHN